jgi:hypothetical protein
MTVYKFRVTYEDDDSIFRDIEIKPSQTITDFEAVIVSAYNLPATATGQFFRSNDNWQHLKQLNIAPIVDEKKGKGKAKAVALPILVAYIDDPHQKFIYDYKGSQEFTFLIELISLNGTEKSNLIYPACVKTQGPSPFKKEDLVAHFSKVAEEEEDEIHTIDDEEDDLGSMNTEGDEEVLEVEAEADVESDAEEVVVDDVDDVEEADEVPTEDDAEDLGAEDFSEDFGGDAEEDFR